MSKKIDNILRNIEKNAVEWGPFPEEMVTESVCYDSTFLLKYYIENYGFDLNKLKSVYKDSHLFYKTFIDEIRRISKTTNLFTLADFISYYKEEERKKYLDFVETIQFKEYDPNITSCCNEFLDLQTYIDEDILNMKNILSIWSVFYKPQFISSNKYPKVDVVYEEPEDTSVIEECKCKIELLNKSILDRYNFIADDVPYSISSIKDEQSGKWIKPKMYDLICYNYSYMNILYLNKNKMANYDDEEGPRFVGDDVLSNITHNINDLSDNGYAIFKIPFALVSHINENLLNRNFIEKVVFLPYEKQFFEKHLRKVKPVYLICKKNKDNDDIIFIDSQTHEQIKVKNEVIKNNNYNLNINIYKKNNPKTLKMYDLNNNSLKQKEIIDIESKLISKLIDEFDFKEEK